MQKHLVSVAIGWALTALALNALAEQTPTPGQWEITVDMKGMPMGGGAKTGKSCITAQAVEAGAEKALVEAAMASAQMGNSSKSEAAKCTLSDIKRSSTNSTWSSNCAGPRGPMQGSGSGNIGAQSAEIVQVFEVNTPMGKRTLTQSIAAKRMGECT
jgi:Protein of unknown function (DUF3617)